MAPLHCSCTLAPGFNVFFILCPLFALHTHPQHQNNAPTPPPDASRERKFSAFLCRRIFTRGRYKGEATGGGDETQRSKRIVDIKKQIKLLTGPAADFPLQSTPGPTTTLHPQVSQTKPARFRSATYQAHTLKTTCRLIKI